MIKNEVQVKRDFDARLAALFVQLAGKFEANTKIEVDNKKTSCKSLMGVVALGILEGNSVTLTAEESADAGEAVGALSEFMGANKV